MSLLRRLAPLALGVLASVGVATAVGAPAGATGSPAYNEQAVLVLARPAIPVEGTNTATITGCKPGTEVPFVLRSWDQPGQGHGRSRQRPRRRHPVARHRRRRSATAPPP